ncbi:MAG: PQQ-dependent sugar dehydrogenase [Solirubrobacteraceae bacterium]
MRRTLITGLAAATLAAAAPAAPAAVQLEPIGSFASPTYVTAPPRDGSRLAVVEQAGTVGLLVDGGKQAAPLLDITGRVSCCGERGLLSLAFAPDYATSGLLYAYYTARSPTGAVTISEFHRSAADPNHIDAGSERVLVQIPHDLQGNHNGGQLQFGPDGTLYAGTGDGGSGGDPAGNAQNTDTSTPPGSAGGVNRDWRLGKLLRIDRTSGSASIHAYGVRNPFRFSFDRQTGDLLVGDVGQDEYEEIDYLPAGTPAGTNFGWNRYEGVHTYPGGAAVGSSRPPGYTFPVIERSHSADGVCSITGGYVVRDPGLPDLAGRYVYGDFCSAPLRSAAIGPSGASDDKPVGLSVASLSSFGEDACGRVYVASLDGAVSRLSQGPSTCAFAADGAPLPTAAPRQLSLRLRYAKRQHALRTRRVALTASCDVRCTITATGRVGQRRLSRATTTAPARAYRRLRLRIGPSSRRALRRSSRPTVRLTITARDRATSRTRTRTVSLRVLR